MMFISCALFGHMIPIDVLGRSALLQDVASQHKSKEVVTCYETLNNWQWSIRMISFFMISSNPPLRICLLIMTDWESHFYFTLMQITRPMDITSFTLKRLYLETLDYIRVLVVEKNKMTCNTNEKYIAKYFRVICICICSFFVWIICYIYVFT